MKPGDPKVRSREALRKAMDRYGQEHARAAARGPEPWPGDLYVLAETAGFAVEWLVVERMPGRCRVVAADTHPILGGSDVPVPAELEGGPLSVRCAMSLQVGVETLRLGERTGTVAPEILAAVRRRLEEVAAGSLDPQASSGGDPEPGLDRWFDEVLAPARAALFPPSLEAPGTARRFGRLAAVAAFLLLLVALGGVSTLAWKSQQRERQARRDVERLVQERRELEAAHQRQLAVLREAQTPRPPAPPPPARKPLQTLAAPWVNLAFASFYPDETRGTRQEVAVPRGSTYLVLQLYVGPEPCKEYKLEITRAGASAAALTARGLSVRDQQVSVAVPRAALPDGSYQLRLDGVCGGERREVAAYEARLKEEAR